MIRSLNFIQPKTRSLRALQSAVAITTTLCAVVAIILLKPSGSPFSTATLSDQIQHIDSGSSPATQTNRVLRAISAQPGQHASPTGKGGIRYVESSSGRILEANPRNGDTSPIIDRRIPGIAQIVWTPDGSHGFLSQIKNAEEHLSHLTVANASISPIASSISSFAVSPDGNRLAIARPEDDYSVIEILGVDGGVQKELFRTRADAPVLQWTANNSISLSTNDGSTGTILLINTDNGVRTIVKSFRNLEYSWSPGGISLLVSYESDKGVSTLSVIDVATGIERMVPFETSARKCAWEGEYAIVCGIPDSKELLRGASAEKTATRDALQRCDITTMETEKIPFVYEGLISVIDPLIVGRMPTLVFQNLYDKLLYGLPLQ